MSQHWMDSTTFPRHEPLSPFLPSSPIYAVQDILCFPPNAELQLPLSTLLHIPTLPDVMAGPSRVPPRQTARADPLQPPRPPNAWILYRSDKLHQIPPGPPGQPKRAQAEVSKLISEMWKAESNEVRAEYERLADMKKAEHHALYPHYRFQPMKKEDKARLREEKRAAKERAKEEAKKSKTRHIPYMMPFMPAVHSPYYAPHVAYGPAGPSPPLSAASSPSDSPSPLTSDSQHGPYYQAGSTSSSPQASSSSQDLTVVNESSGTSTSRHASYNAMLPPPAPADASASTSNQQHLPAPAQNAWSAPHAQQLGPVADASNNASAVADSPAQQWSFDFEQSAPAQSLPIGDELVQLDLPVLPPNWDMEEGNDSLLQAMMSATTDPSVFQLTGIHQDSFLFDPPPQIDVSLDPLYGDEEQAQFAQFSQLLDNLDFSTLPGASDFSTDSSTVDPSLPAFFDMPQELDQQHNTSQESLMQFLNLDAGSVELQPQFPTAPSRPAAPPHSQSMPVVPSTSSRSTPYVPPSGAANASTRRVAGSWRPAQSYSPIPDSPVEHATLQPWGVSAN
ncbi:hypothetical protein AcV7_004143 [Taiwanofungus camphoratus]|nr:hypothetical protein AcV7_004143 [Antrodia cinnamomea]